MGERQYYASEHATADGGRVNVAWCTGGGLPDSWIGSVFTPGQGEVAVAVFQCTVGIPGAYYGPERRRDGHGRAEAGPRKFQVWFRGTVFFTDNPDYLLASDGALRLRGVTAVDQWSDTLGDYVEVRRIP